MSQPQLCALTDEISENTKGTINRDNITGSQSNGAAAAAQIDWNIDAHSKVNFEAFNSNNDIDNLMIPEQGDPTNSTEPSAKGPGMDDVHIYRRFAAALSISVLRILSSAGNWTPLGPSIALRHPWDNATLNAFDGMESTILLKISTVWQPSSDIVVMSSLSPASHIRRLSDVGDPKSLNQGRQLILAPSGMIAIYLGPGEQPREQSRRSKIRRLSRMNMAIDPSGPWLRVRYHNSSESQPFLWPSQLSYVNSQPGVSAWQTASLFDVAEGADYVDPLVVAEQWYLNREARAAALTALKQKEAATPQARFDDDSDYDDERIDDLSQSHVFAPQIDPTGVYPTPPDGPGSLTQIALANQHQSLDRVVATSSATASIRADETLTVDHLDHAKRVRGIDLFGDVEAELFADNDLTEADFNFFDEPSEDDQNGMETGQATLMSNSSSFAEKSISKNPLERLKSLQESVQDTPDLVDDDRTADKEDRELGTYMTSSREKNS